MFNRIFDKGFSKNSYVEVNNLVGGKSEATAEKLVSSKLWSDLSKEIKKPFTLSKNHNKMFKNHPRILRWIIQIW